MVQNAEHIFRHKVIPLKEKLGCEIIYSEGNVIVGAAARIQDFFDDPLIKNHFPQLNQYKPLFASEQIRHMGTIAGNIVNASPIGDLTIILMALDASLDIKSKNGASRIVKLKEFYLGYKKTDLKEAELIQKIILNSPDAKFDFSFIKVCKRQYLDISSVNSAMGLVMQDDKVLSLDFAIGGVAAIPFYTSETVDFLKGKVLDKRTILKALESLQQEIFPISDIRGSAIYKRLLVRQQFLGHILNLLPKSFDERAIKDLMIKSNGVYEEH